ncbi:MAG: hypothetical protein M3063_02660 [Actinomycetota bacterium]|nr:hypothetical protein [Actinomycetota bacterium]
MEVFRYCRCHTGRMVVERQVWRASDVQVSRASLLFLFADRAVSRSRVSTRMRGHAGAPVPCTHHFVQLGPFEQLLVVWALWELVADGYATTEFAPGMRSLVPGRPAKPVLALVPTNKSPERRSLAASFAGAIPSGGSSATNVVLNWTTERDPLPVFGVLREVRPELVAAGLLGDRVKPPPRRRRWSLNLVMSGAEGHCDRIDSLSGRFDAVWREWQTFREDEEKIVRGFKEGANRGLSCGAIICSGGGDG